MLASGTVPSPQDGHQDLDHKPSFQVLNYESDSSASGGENEQSSDPESPPAATSPESEHSSLSDDDQLSLTWAKLVDAVRDIMQKRKRPTISAPSDYIHSNHAPHFARSCTSRRSHKTFWVFTHLSRLCLAARATVHNHG